MIEVAPTARRSARALRLAALIVVVAGCAAVTGCSAPEQTEPTELMGPDEYQREYEETIADFPEEMPSDISFPPTPAPLDGLAEVSVGEAQAYFLWACAWQDKLLNSDDPAVKEAAIEQIRGFSSTSWARLHYNDPDGVWVKMADKAALGDVSEVRSSFDGDCIYYEEARNGS